MGQHCAFVISKYLLQESIKLHDDKKISVTVSSAINSDHCVHLTFEAIDQEQIHVEILVSEKEKEFLLGKNNHKTVQNVHASSEQHCSLRRSQRRSGNKTHSAELQIDYEDIPQTESGKLDPVIHTKEKHSCSAENFVKKVKPNTQLESEAKRVDVLQKGNNDNRKEDCYHLGDSSSQEKNDKLHNIKLEVVDEFVACTDNNNSSDFANSSLTVSDENEWYDGSLKRDISRDSGCNNLIVEEKDEGDIYEHSNNKDLMLDEIEGNTKQGNSSLENEKVLDSTNDRFDEDETFKHEIINSEKSFVDNHLNSKDDVNEIEISDNLKTKRDKNGRFSCFLCSKKVLNLFTHIKFMHKEAPDYVKIMKKLKKIFKQNSCNFCHLVFSTREKLNIHQEAAHKKGKSYVGFKCDICGAVLRNNSSFKHHLIRHSENEENRFKCNKCDVTFHSEQLLSRHKVHECGLTFSCSFCEFTTTANKFLLKHIEINHTGSYHQFTDCEICPKKLKNIHCLYRHVLTNHQNSPKFKEETERLKSLQTVKCPHCSMNIKSRSLKRHIMAIHTKQEDQGLIKCQQCGIFLKSIETLRTHIKNVHETKGQNFTCLTCNNSFRTKSNLKYHMKNVHADPTITYNCKECNYTTSSKKYLKNHYGQTHVHANYMCGDCGRTFKTPDKLRRHNMLIHNPHEIEQHVCDVCSKSFNVKANLTKHMKTVHLKQYAYTCNICRMGFQTINLIKQHFIKKHSDSSLPDFNDPIIRIPSNPSSLMPSNNTNLRSNSLTIGTTILTEKHFEHNEHHTVSGNDLQEVESAQMFKNIKTEVSSSSTSHGDKVFKIIEYHNYADTRENQVLSPGTQNMFIEDQDIMYQEQEVTTAPMVYEGSE